MNNTLYILIFSTLLFSCSDSGELAPESNERMTLKTDDVRIETKLDTVTMEGTLAAVKIGDKWGYINAEGEVVIEPKFDSAWSFSEGLAVVGIGDSSGKYGYINPEGEIVIKPQFGSARRFSEGLAGVKIGSIFSKWGYINAAGEVVIEPQFDEAKDFSEGLAGVKIGRSYMGKWGYINAKGEYVIEPQFYDAYSSQESNGRTITKYVDNAWYFSEGLVRVMIGDKWGYIDREGKIVIDPQFDLAFSFNNGLALVRKNDKKKGYINTEGEFVIEPQVDPPFYISTLSNGLAVLKIDDKHGYINAKGEVVIEPRFDDARSFRKTK